MTRSIVGAVVLVALLLGGIGCGGKPKQQTTPGKFDPAEVKAHDAQVDQEEKAQREKEQP
ncbi:MAG: hypothetical protein KatS3mg110_3086 [Pirellulaceae bacterium]|nr:MAG: hypothetical protein KatS3mg110_3086 [Pirellulaceae bacterium]